MSERTTGPMATTCPRKSLALRIQTPEHLARLVFLSYRYSQGGIGVQSRLLLHVQDEHHPDMFQEPLIHDVKRHTHKLVGAFFMNQVVHPPLPYTWDHSPAEDGERSQANAYDDVEGVFEKVLASTEDEEYAHDISSITRALVTMDLSYLLRMNGRADVNDAPSKDRESYPKDPFESQFISYAILGKSTTTPEYDLLFEQVGNLANIEQLDDHTQIEIEQILAVYLREHAEPVNSQKLEDIQSMLGAR